MLLSHEYKSTDYYDDHAFSPLSPSSYVQCVFSNLIIGRNTDKKWFSSRAQRARYAELPTPVGGTDHTGGRLDSYTSTREH
jgi:hypothetical protein